MMLALLIVHGDLTYQGMKCDGLVQPDHYVAEWPTSITCQLTGSAYGGDDCVQRANRIFETSATSSAWCRMECVNSDYCKGYSWDETAGTCLGCSGIVLTEDDDFETTFFEEPTYSIVAKDKYCYGDEYVIEKVGSFNTLYGDDCDPYDYTKMAECSIDGCAARCGSTDGCAGFTFGGCGGQEAQICCFLCNSNDD